MAGDPITWAKIKFTSPETEGWNPITAIRLDFDKATGEVSVDDICITICIPDGGIYCLEAYHSFPKKAIHIIG